LIVSGDGTWKKRGPTSRFGVTTLAGKFSKKIIDTVAKSTYCKSCEVWEKKKNTHPEEYEDWLEGHDDCDANHIGSAGKMEVDSVKEMFGRSIDQYGVKYTRYIGDCDSATYKFIEFKSVRCANRKTRMLLTCEKKNGNSMPQSQKTNERFRRKE